MLASLIPVDGPRQSAAEASFGWKSMLIAVGGIRHCALQPSPKRSVYARGPIMEEAQGYRQPSAETLQGSGCHAKGTDTSRFLALVREIKGHVRLRRREGRKERRRAYGRGH